MCNWCKMFVPIVEVDINLVITAIEEPGLLWLYPISNLPSLVSSCAPDCKRYLPSYFHVLNLYPSLNYLILFNRNWFWLRTFPHPPVVCFSIFELSPDKEPENISLWKRLANCNLGPKAMVRDVFLIYCQIIKFWRFCKKVRFLYSNKLKKLETQDLYFYTETIRYHGVAASLRRREVCNL